MLNKGIVPFFNLEEQNKLVKEEILLRLAQTMDRGDFILGQEVQAFEAMFAAYCECKFAVGLNNGTSALYVALNALGIKPGDEVIVPSATFSATAAAVIQLGATPVFVDIDESTWTIDPNKIQSKITSKTVAIIAVHLYGNPCKLDELQEVAKRNSLFLIEDAAQSHGALYKGKKVGSFGDMACFSFYPSKNLGAMGDAGAVCFNNEDFLEKIKAIRNCGKDRNGEFSYLGYNYRIDPFQASVLQVKLHRLETYNQKRIEIANQYKANITNQKITWQTEQANSKSVYHLFVVKVDNREKFVAHLEKHQIGYSFHYKKPVHLLEAFKNLGLNDSKLEQTEELYAHCVSLPLFPEMTTDQIERVIEVVNQY